MPEKIPLSRVYQSETIDRRILEVVKGGNYILGPECKEFEKELAAYFGVPHAVLSSSWTAAVMLLHMAQGLKKGDEVLVPSLTAFPSIEPMIHAGARPVFCDVDETYTIDLADAQKNQLQNRRHPPRLSLRPPRQHRRIARAGQGQQSLDRRRLRPVPRRQMERQARRQLRRACRRQFLSVQKLNRLRRRRRGPHLRSQNRPEDHHAPQPRAQGQIPPRKSRIQSALQRNSSRRRSRATESFGRTQRRPPPRRGCGTAGNSPA